MKLIRVLYLTCTILFLIGWYWSCTDQLVLPPVSLSVELTADPGAGEAPLQGVDLTAQISGEAKGPFAYRFDCTNDGTFDVEITTDKDSYTATDVCSYPTPGLYIAKVVVASKDMSANDLVVITVETPALPSAASDTVTISMKDNFFSPREVTVKPGITIIWPNVGNRPHTSTSDDGIWDSGTVAQGASFSWTVPANTPFGTRLPYFCVFHGDRGGVGMAGTLIVNDGTAPPPSTDTVRVSMKDNFFSPKDVTVEAGTTVLWKNLGLIAHTSTSDDGLWDSGLVERGDTYAWTVPTETIDGKSFPYYCVYHGDPGGVGMAGTIHVGSDETTLSVSLDAEPASGEAPLQDVDLIAQVSGTATGTIIYRFDCTGDGILEHETSTSDALYTATDLCNYEEARTYTAKVQAERQGLTAEATTTITVEAPPPPPTGNVVTVSMKDNFFSPREVTVKPGTKINWPNVGKRPHTSTSDDGVWDSGTIDPGADFSWTVPANAQSGTSFPYYCVFHGDKGGKGMAGVIHVSSKPPTGPTLSVALDAEPASGEAPLQDVDLIAQVSGTATGTIIYRFDCTGDGTLEHETSTSDDLYTATDLCNYEEARTYTAKVLAERQGLTAEATTTITVEAPPPPPTGNTVTVSMKDNFFSPREVTVKPGTKINWPNVGKRPHTSTSDDGIWDSGTIDPGATFSWTVPANTQSGTSFPYYCVFHGDKGGKGMAGVIHVSSKPPTGPTLSVALDAEPASGEAPLQDVDLIAQVSGTATGTIIYRFDCTGDGILEHETSTSDDLYTATDLCNYEEARTYTAKVLAERQGLTAEATTTITVEAPPPPPTGNTVTVSMKDNFFSPKEVTVKPGTKIIWDNVGRKKHTATSDDGLWDSGTVNSGETWSWTVPANTSAGATLAYYCVFHGDKGGKGMAGVIHVTDEAQPPPTGGEVVVSMKDNFFSPKDVSVSAGTKIIWDNVGRKKHTATSDDDLWDSGTVNSGETWSWTVPANTPLGTAFPYYCVFHGDRGGKGMAGTIQVGGGTTPPAAAGDTVIVTTAGSTFKPKKVEIEPGDTVLWKFSGSVHNVTFKNQDKMPAGGNIPDSAPDTEASRTFENQGEYDYKCTLHKGQKGRIRVRADDD